MAGLSPVSEMKLSSGPALHGAPEMYAPSAIERPEVGVGLGVGGGVGAGVSRAVGVGVAADGAGLGPGVFDAADAVGDADAVGEAEIVAGAADSGATGKATVTETQANAVEVACFDPLPFAQATALN